ncbi:MAG TPA: acyltransferase family protein [Mycobacteriales bacterium]|nr:acyltransferase family protein [Mycobacteriales bacterium]
MSGVATQPSRLRYIPALDGMRGLSLPGTILTHYALFLEFNASAPHWLTQVGPLTLNIQMFFVLSGALITSLLVSEHQRTGRVSLKSFYLRRSRRLGPALLATVVVIGLVEVFWQGSRADSPLGSHPWLALGAVSAFVGNWVLFRISGGIGWLGPAWTLGIEEQFYLTWPILLVAALRRRMRRATLYLCFAVVLAGTLLAASAFESHVGKWRAFYATPVQLPSILFGCALGYELTTNPTGRLSRVVRSRLVALTGFAGMVATSIFLVHHPAPLYKGGYAVYATFACLLIGHCFVRAAEPTAITRVLAWKPFVVIGQISYEAYLIHVIVIIGMAQLFPTVHVYPMMAIDTIVVALVSAIFYYSVEQPIRKRGWKSAFASRPRPRRLTGPRGIAIVGGLAGVVAIAGVGVIAARTATPVPPPVVVAKSGSSVTNAAVHPASPRLGTERVTTMAPAGGSILGGETLTIRGRHFTRDTQVYFNAVRIRRVTRVNSTTLRIVTPSARRVAHDTSPATLHGRRVTVSVRDTRGVNVAGRYTYR